MYTIQIICFLGLLSAIMAQNACLTPNLERGLCVPYKECRYIIDLSLRYPNGLPSNERDYVFQSRCSSNNEPLRLCCTIPANVVAPTPTKASEPDQELNPNADFLSQLNPEGYAILDSLSCGQVQGDKVAGGTETGLYEYPWMALLSYDAPDDQFKCGGSLISDQFVLTAAHCVNVNVAPLIGVRLGEHNIDTFEDCMTRGEIRECNPPVEDYGIANTFQYNFNSRKRINDIALIKLDRKVVFKKHIKPICLPITPDSRRFNNQNEDFIAGWGSTEQGVKSNVLLKATVNSLPLSTCQERFAIDISPKKHLCAGDLKTGRDNCRGDSGGPLLQFTKYKNFKRFIQYGIVASGGTACDLRQAFPGIYTNVLNYLPWITNKIVL
ncbi:serine protease grass [Stomoxys calcitrans]|uniref:CLIP domain-containing serine protease n=1 Tax=Stomoxys calcitrans TaxID=35570 RepID=A0A1I8PPY7_STOCA|nr:serine protease grass [Stomoxys calcitrans]